MGKIFEALEKSGTVEHQQINDKTNNIHTIESRFTLKSTESFEIMSQNLITVHKPHSVESEQFRNLKNNILFPEKGEAPRTIMVTSTAPGEGKSFVAANLAVSIAQSIDEYVLLMDCDLRAPSIHTLFGLEAFEGLTEYLASSKPLSHLILNTYLDKLKILPAGSIPKNPSELLSSEQMRRLLHEVKLRYNDRYVIVDTPPPYITSETSVLSRQIDGIVIVVRQEKTRKQDVFDVIDIYGREKILGIVYNDAKSLIGYGRYGYGKYGYGKYGYGK